MVAVDTSVLLSIFKGENDGAAWLAALERAAQTAPLVACPVVFAEVRAFFTDDQTCRSAFAALGIVLSEIEEESAFLAGGVFHSYRRKGGPRTTILRDFLIAAHAARQAVFLATADRGYIRKYFPSLKILAL